MKTSRRSFFAFLLGAFFAKKTGIATLQKPIEITGINPYAMGKCVTGRVTATEAFNLQTVEVERLRKLFMHGYNYGRPIHLRDIEVIPISPEQTNTEQNNT